jgi:preprotein translocase subunit SecE
MRTGLQNRGLGVRFPPVLPFQAVDRSLTAGSTHTADRGLTAEGFRIHMKTASAEHEDSLGGRARESVTGWWGQSRRFLAEVRNEMSRVTWPGRKEVYATTIVVIITAILFGVFLYGIDLVLNAVMAWVFRTFGTA